MQFKEFKNLKGRMDKMVDEIRTEALKDEGVNLADPRYQEVELKLKEKLLENAGYNPSDREDYFRFEGELRDKALEEAKEKEDYETITYRPTYDLTKEELEEKKKDKISRLKKKIWKYAKEKLRW